MLNDYKEKDMTSIDVLCRYRVKPGKEDAFKKVLLGHWAILHQAGLTTNDPATLRRCQDQAGNVAYVEEFAWKNHESIQSAHESPAVMGQWEPMGALCEDMEFWHVENIDG